VTLPKPLAGLNPREYEHPFDAKALNALQATPGLDHLVRAYNKHFVERDATIEYTGSYLQITASTYPKIHAALDRVCDTINLPSRPSFYVKWNYDLRGLTTGVDHPIILLDSGAIDYLDEVELLFLLGHEVGHIKSRHTLYHQIGDTARRWSSRIANATMGIGSLISMPLLISLFWWSRMSELTADRAGLLACQDLDAATRVMMKWSGMPRKHFQTMPREAFLEQARQFRDLDYSVLNRAWKWMYSLDMTHPWTVLRAAELMRWVESGEYQAVLDRKTAAEDKPPVLVLRVCHQCGGQLSGAEAFCPACGQRLACAETP
jgi:Zn-dependent protease with chaperone function